MNGGVVLGPARVLLQESATTAERVQMKDVRWVTKKHLSCLVRCTALAFPFQV